MFEKTKAFDTIYKWFDYLKQQESYPIGYVIMPNHLHAVIAFKNNGQSINTRVGNGKRFIAYEIVKRLTAAGEFRLLEQLGNAVNTADRKRGKKHEIFEPSFDCKPCYSDKLINEKLNYMHNNPCKGKWSLADEPIGYKHSSALFYATGNPGIYEVLSCAKLGDMDLSTLVDRR